MMLRIFELLSSFYARFFFSARGKSFISWRSEIIGKAHITFGSSVRVLKNAKLDTSTNPSAPDYRKNTRNGFIKIGSGSKIKEYVFLISYDGFVEVGDNCTINPFTIIYGQGGVKIGSNVMIAAHCVIISANHSFDDVATPMAHQPLKMKGIEIMNDVWIGAGVKVLDGVSIGTGSVIAAGSIVTTTLEPFGVYGGVPAKLIRRRTNGN